MQTKKEKPKHLGRGLASLISSTAFHDIESEYLVPTPVAPPLSAPLIPPLSAPANPSGFPADKELSESLREINLITISPNPYQPRTLWNEQELLELTESIKANGIIQPILVRPASTGFQIIAGERRFRAAQMAGMITIPALVRKATDEQMLELALVENIHRTNLNPIERAKAYQNYLNTFSLTQSEAAQRLGEDRSVVANYMRLLDLPAEIKQMLIDNQLTMGHARAILSLPTDDLKRKLANRAMAGRLSVREVERLVKKYMLGNQITNPKASSKAAHIADLERKLTNELGTKVTIDAHRNGKRGKITIEFYSLDEFDRITERLGLNAVEELS